MMWQSHIELSSYLVDFLRAVGENLGTEEETSFPMLLLDFRRTAIEKLFAIHSRVEQYVERGERLGKYTRHYYDLYCLFQQPEVRALLESGEYQELKLDCDRISRASFGDSYRGLSSIGTKNRVKDFELLETRF